MSSLEEVIQILLPDSSEEMKKDLAQHLKGITGPIDYNFYLEPWQIEIGESFKTDVMMESVCEYAERLTGFKFKLEGEWGDFTITRIA